MFDLFCVLGVLRQPFLAGWLTCFSILEIWGNHFLPLDWLVLRFWRFEATISCRVIDFFCDLGDLRQPFAATWLTCSAFWEIWGNYFLPLDWLVLWFWKFEATIFWHLIDLFCDFGDLGQAFPAAWLTCSAILKIWGNFLIYYTYLFHKCLLLFCFSYEVFCFCRQMKTL